MCLRKYCKTIICWTCGTYQNIKMHFFNSQLNHLWPNYWCNITMSLSNRQLNTVFTHVTKFNEICRSFAYHSKLIKSICWGIPQVCRCGNIPYDVTVEKWHHIATFLSMLHMLTLASNILHLFTSSLTQKFGILLLFQFSSVCWKQTNGNIVSCSG